LTEDQTKAVNDIVSKAMGARLKDFEKKQAKSLEEFGATLASKVSESVLAAVGEKLAETKPVEPPAGGEPRKLAEDDPIVKGLRKQVEQLTKQSQDREAAEKAAAAQVKASKLREKLTVALSKHGIEGLRASNAVAVLIDAHKRVNWEGDDSEALTFKDESGDIVDIATGLQSWVSSDEGKLYAPPRGAVGSGERGTGRNGSQVNGSVNNGKQPSTTELGQGLASVFGIPVS